MFSESLIFTFSSTVSWLWKYQHRSSQADHLFQDVSLFQRHKEFLFSTCLTSCQDILVACPFSLILLLGLEQERGKSSKGQPVQSPMPPLLSWYWESHHPKPVGMPKTTLWAARVGCGTLGRLNLFSWQSSLSWEPELPPELLGQPPILFRTWTLVKHGWPYPNGLYSQSWMREPHCGSTVFPGDPRESSPAGVAETGARIDCLTVRCSLADSRTCSSVFFRVLLCSCLSLLPTTGGVPASFLLFSILFFFLLFSVAGASGQKPQSAQSRLCSPEEPP